MTFGMICGYAILTALTLGAIWLILRISGITKIFK